jgi:hypothetical protein
MSSKVRRARRSVAGGVVAFLLAATPAYALITPTKVKGGGGAQVLPAVNTNDIGWSSSTKAHPNHFDAYAQLRSGGAITKVNGRRTVGYMGAFDGDTSTIFYQQTSGYSSDIYTDDFLVPGSRALAPDINTKLWEYEPSVSPGYILFGRNAFTSSSSPWLILLYNRATHSTTQLDQVTYRCGCVWPGQVTDQYATWTRCSRTSCAVKYYDIASGLTFNVPNPQGKLQYNPSVSAATGDFYFVASGFGCGKHVALYRWNPVSGGDPVRIASLEAGYDVFWSTFTLDDSVDSHQDVYFDRTVCVRHYPADIYELIDADTAAPGPAGAAMGPTNDAARVHAMAPNQVPAGV